MNPETQNLWQGDPAEAPAAAAYPQSSDPTPPPAPVEGSISWQASEYILHEKDIRWFIGLIVATLVLVALAVFLLKSWTFTALIIVMAVSVVVYAQRPPRVLEYSLGRSSLHINERVYSLHDFRAFSVIQEGAIYSIMLIPIKRFMPPVTLYFPQDQGERIVDLLGSVIPLEQRKLDPIDKLVRKLRF